MQSNKIYGFLICILFLNTILAQQNNSFNFQTEGANEDHVTINSNVQLRPTSGMTLEAWVKPTEDPVGYDRNGIISYFTLDGPTTESGFAFIYTAGKWRFVVITADDEDVFPQLASWPGIDIPYDGNTWTHIAGTYDGTNARIFKNGLLEQEYSAANVGGAIVWEDINTDFYIGKYLDNSKSFKGSIDEVRLWNIARLDTEIQGSMNGTINVDESGLIGYWKFDDNQSATIVDYAEGSPSPGQSPGSLTNAGNGEWDTDVFAPSGPCFNLELTEADFPYNHLANLNSSSGDNWDFRAMGTATGGNINSANGYDYGYKLTLSAPAIIYVTTCDVETNVDVHIGIFTEDCNSNSFTFYQDDSNTEIILPDSTTPALDYDCISGFESNPTFANMLPKMEFEAGTYYIVVDDRAELSEGTVRTWFGYSLLVDSTDLASDLNSVKYFFNQGVYGGDYPQVYAGNGTGLETSDFNISIIPNGGSATSASLPSISNLLGSGLSGGEQSIVLDMSYNNPPSGTESAKIKPATVRSVFNEIGVPLLDLQGIEFNLEDLVPPVITFDPNNGDTLLPASNIIISFSERIYIAPGGEDANNDNIDGYLTLTYTDGAQEAIPFDANIDPADMQITIDPNSNLSELRTANVIITANAFQDGGGNKVSLQNSDFLVADVTLPIIDSTTMNSDNSFTNFYFSEPIFSSLNGSGTLVPADFVISFSATGNASAATINSITKVDGNALEGGENAVRLFLSFNNPPDGTEVINISPANSQVFDNFGNAMNANANNQAFDLNDILVPSVEFDPVNGSNQLFPNGTITVTFSEPVKYANGDAITSELITNSINLKYLDGEQESIAFSASINDAKTVVVLTPNSLLTELRSLQIGFGGNVFTDLNENTISSSYSANYSVKDITPPTVESSTLAIANAYIIFRISEGIFTNDDGTGAVQPQDFSVIFNMNGGNASSMTVVSVTDENGLILVGGETIVRLGISFDSQPAGVETATVTPNGIYDQGGNVLDPSVSGQSFEFFDQLSPSLEITTDPQPIDGLIYPQSNFMLLFSEIIQNSSENIPNSSDIAAITSLSYADGDQENIDFTGSINAGNNIISINPDFDMEEWRPVQINISSGMQDTIGNISNGSSANYKTRDITVPEIRTADIDSLNNGLNISVSEGLFATENEAGGLDQSDFEVINFNQNNGNASSVTITALTSFEGVPLIGGESEIRINITVDSPPAGVETFTISPIAGRVFDRGGNALAPSENSQSFTLFDLLSPSVAIDPTTDSLIYPSETFIITFDEPVVKLDGTPISNDNLSFIINLQYTSEGSENINFNGSINSLKTVLNIVPITQLDQKRSINLSFSNVFMDQSGNLVNPLSANYIVRDVTAPTFDSSRYAIDNTQIIIFMAEPVYGNSEATAGLDTSDFNLTFQDNGGEADSVYIESVTNTSGTQLVGGESSIQINLGVKGSPNGDETININAKSNAIFDLAGNIMNSSQITSIDTMTAAPKIILSDLSIDNTYLELIFSEDVFSTHDNSEVLGVQDFILTYNSNNGNCEDMTINSILTTSNSIIVNGEDSVRIKFSLDGIPSGVETFTLSPVDNEAVFNNNGVYMDPETILGPFTLYDLLIPTYSVNISNGDTNIKSDTTLIISFSEAVRNTNNSSLNNANVDDHFILYNLSDSVEIAFNASVNTEKNVITIAAVDTFKSEHEIQLKMDGDFEDLADNLIPNGMDIVFFIRDYIKPEFDTLILAGDNSYIDIYFSDQIFSSDSSYGAPSLDDFTFEFFQNGGNAKELVLAGIQTFQGTNVTGGENKLRVITEFDNKASGREFLFIKPATSFSLFDESGNPMASNSQSDTLNLNDVLVPTVDTVNIWQGGYVGINEYTNIGLVFSEPIDSIDFEISSRRDSSFSYETEFTSDSLRIILSPPLLSLDTIDLIITSMVDTVGLSTVELSYRFLTPALGDFDTPPNDTINLDDLTQFVLAWNSDDFTKELGPVSGNFPHFKLHPDRKFGLDDGMVFTQMWRWSLKRYGVQEIAQKIIGEQPNFKINKNSILISPPINSISGQVIVDHNQGGGNINISNTPNQKNGFALSSGDILPGKLLYEYSHLSKNSAPIKINFPGGLENDSTISVRFSFFDSQSKLVGQGDTVFILEMIPNAFFIHKNYPNPFNAKTTIRYEIPINSDIRIDIYDITGRFIKNLVNTYHSPGKYKVEWNGKNMFDEEIASGIYFYKIQSGVYTRSVKMIFLK